jgi:hypothetical protein
MDTKNMFRGAAGTDTLEGLEQIEKDFFRLYSENRLPDPRYIKTQEQIIARRQILRVQAKALLAAQKLIIEKLKQESDGQSNRGPA